MTIIFVTGNQAKHQEVLQLLAGLDIRTQKVTMPPRQDITLEQTARERILTAYEQVQRPCFTEVTELYLDGIGILSGADFKKKVREMGEQAFYQTYGGRGGRTQVAVAYTQDGNPEQVLVFIGHCEGRLLTEPRGHGGYGWDCAWLPDGYSRTLAEMAVNKAFVNMRNQPYLELGDLLRGRRFGGVFEAHVTVTEENDGRLEDFRRICETLNVKCVWIELPDGQTRFQPMTASFHHGSLREAQDQVHNIAQTLAREGFNVSRVKLEAVGRNRDIPLTDADAKPHPENYFEYHIKVLIPAGAATDELQNTCRKHNAHLSHNARKKRQDGAMEKFITLRIYRCGQLAAQDYFKALYADVLALKFHVLQCSSEYTVYDSNISVDQGWID